MRFSAEIRLLRVDSDYEIIMEALRKQGLAVKEGDYLVRAGESEVTVMSGAMAESLFRDYLEPSGVPRKPVVPVRRKLAKASAREGKDGDGLGHPVLRALEDGPKGVRQILEWLQTHAVDSAESRGPWTLRKISQTLWYLHAKLKARLQCDARGRNSLWTLSGSRSENATNEAA